MREREGELELLMETRELLGWSAKA